MGDVEAFLAGAYGVQPHQWRAGSFDDLLSLADIDAQLTGAGLRRPAVRLVRDGEVIEPSAWTRRARSGSVWIDDLVDPGRTLDLYAGGATIVLQSLQRWWPPLARFCRQLEDALGHPVQANAYLTPPGAAGLSPHHDTHDVFVLQVQGTKHWTVREPVVDAPLARHRSDHAEAAGQPVRADLHLTLGECLYLPRGFIHSAAAQTDTSLHLTIGVLALTRHDLLRRIVDAAAEVPEFRRTLPVDHATDVDAADRVVKEVVADLMAWLTGFEATEMAADHLDREAKRRAPSFDGRLLDLADLPDLADDTRVELRPGVRWRLEPAGAGRVALELPDRRLDLPDQLAPALRRLLDGTSHSVGDLGDLLDAGSRLVLVTRLVREGLLRTFDGP